LLFQEIKRIGEHIKQSMAHQRNNNSLTWRHPRGIFDKLSIQILPLLRPPENINQSDQNPNHPTNGIPNGDVEGVVSVGPSEDGHLVGGADSERRIRC
jgi:hypothetical protein